MAFDFNKLKQRFLTRNAKQPDVAQPEVAKQQAPAAAKKPSALNAKVEEFKQGVRDIKAVSEEGKYRLFAKQVVVVLIAFFGVRFLVDKLNAQKEQIVDRVSAIAIQQTNQDDYLNNKNRLLHLEPLFPDMGKKNEWLVQTLMREFAAHDIQANINGNVVEKTEDNYTIVSQDVTLQQKFADLGQFLADVESGENFLRISSLTITKLTDAASLGENTVNIRFNTVFPREKYAKRLFKDYAQQMKKIEAETAPAADEKTPQTEAESKVETQPQAETTAPADEEKANAA